jgi:formate dehydrogenase major subunit
MLLTRKSAATDAARPSALVSSLARGIGRAIPTMDRRAFLRPFRPWGGRRHGRVATGAGEEGQAADAPKAAGDAKNVVVKRTVCGHCSVGCAIDAVVENGVWVRQEPVFDSPINLGSHCAKAQRCARTPTASTASGRR